MTSWVRSNAEGKQADTGGEKPLLWSHLALFDGPADDGET